MDWTHLALAVGAAVVGYFMKRFTQPATHSAIDEIVAERQRTKARQELAECFAPQVNKDATKTG